MDKFFAQHQIPLNQSLITKSLSELHKFTKVIQHMLSRQQKHPISLAESLAFRLLASIDWSQIKTNEEFKEIFQPIISLKHLNLDSCLTKIHCGFLRLKEEEVKDALHMWSHLRVKLNNSLADPSRQETDNYDNDDSVNQLVEEDDGLVVLYAMAKWAADESTMRFSTFLHYGIPRAKLRAISGLNSMSDFNDNPIHHTEDNLNLHVPEPQIDSFPINSGNNLTIASSRISDESDLDSTFTSFSEKCKHSVTTSITNDSGDSGIHDETSPKASKTYYYRRKHVKKMDQPGKLNQIFTNTRKEFLANGVALERRSESIDRFKETDVSSGQESCSHNRSRSINTKTDYGKPSATGNEHMVIANFDNSLAELQRNTGNCKAKIAPKVVPVKGGLVTNFGNVYFPKK